MVQSQDNDRELLQLLLQLQLLTRDQITEALAYQCRLPQPEPIRSILIDMELLSESTLRQAEASFSSPVDLRDSFQRSLDQILAQADAMQQAAIPAPRVPEPPVTRPLGQSGSEPVLHTAAHSVPEPLAVPRSDSPPQPQHPSSSGLQAAGAFARRRQPQTSVWGAVSPSQQPTANPGSDVISPSQRVPLGQILLKQQALEEWQLMHALGVQQTTAPRPRLGTLLVRLGYADKQTVARALSLQVQTYK